MFGQAWENWDEVFKAQTLNNGHIGLVFLVNEHLYYRPMEGKLSSIAFPLKNIGT